MFGGDCVLTPARVVIEPQAGRSVTRLFPEDVRRKVIGVDYSRLMLEPGDGEVTKPSLAVPTSATLISTHYSACLPANDRSKISELRRGVECLSE